MEKYRCFDREGSFLAEDIAWQKELVGEYWGRPAYKDIACCPYCGSSDINEESEEEE